MRAVRSLCLSVLAAVSTLPAFAAEPAPGLPTTQPKLLHIEREFIKAGRSAAHAHHEAGWPAAFAKAGDPSYYVALTSMTGGNEAWYLIPGASYTAESESMKRFDANTELSTEVKRLAAADAEFVERVQSIHAIARPDLSFGKFPDVAKIRYYEITIYTVKPGYNAVFDNIVKAYGTAHGRVAPDSSYRVYQVVAGMPEATYIVMRSFEDYGALDQLMGEHEKTLQAGNAEEQEQLSKYPDVIVKAETNRFRVDPEQSYVPKETRERFPDFWGKK